MALRPTFLNVSLSATMLLCLPGAIPGQALPHADYTGASAGRLSEPFHSATPLEALPSNGRRPNWNHGYVAHMTGNGTPGSASVEVFDRNGKHVIDARIWFPGVVEVFLVDAVPLEGGGVLASGHATTDETIFNFVAKTDNSGNVIAVVRTENLWPARVCEQPDGTVWVFGRDLQIENANADANNNVDVNVNDNDYLLLRQYRFEGGLLHSYLSRDSVALRAKAAVGGGGPQGSYLDCGKSIVSLYLNQTDEFVQVDAAKESMQRWKMDMSPITSGKVTGLGVTESGRVYASLYAVQPGETKVHGLFELHAEPGKPMGSWLPVAGTLSSHREGEIVTQNTFWRLWGADGNNLVIGRQYDPSFSWVRVVH
jgi:hypothetical protein